MKKNQLLQFIGGVYDSVAKPKLPINLNSNNKTPKNNSSFLANSFAPARKESI